MSLAALTNNEREFVLRCIQAVATERFITREDFGPILGVTPQEVLGVVNEWSALDETREVAWLTINNSLNGLLIWYGWQDENLTADQTLIAAVGGTAVDIERVFTKWRGHPAT